MFINTNQKNSPDDEYNMLVNHKCAAYGTKKHVIDTIPADTLVFLYRSGYGIIATGFATGIVKMAPRHGVENEEHYMPLYDFKEFLNKPLSASKIRGITGTEIRYNSTKVPVDLEFGTKILKYINKRVC